MRIYITGADGTLGRALVQELRADARTVDWPLLGVSIADFDIGDEGAVAASIASFRPDAVLHLAAIAVTAPCETDPALALRVNVAGVHHVAAACRRAGSRMVYISSDYVFDGVDPPIDGYRETDVPNPLSVYGLTKLAGEHIAETVPEHLVIRTSWLCGGADENDDDALATIRSAERGERHELIDDQYSRPTYTVDLARAIIHLLALEVFPTGIVHIANQGWASRHELGVHALDSYDAALNAQYPPMAVSFDACAFVGARPRTSALNTDRLTALGGSMSDWRDALDRHCASLPRKDAAISAPSTDR
jgi:dTDP-4-dehydrorhamnose reductase